MAVLYWRRVVLDGVAMAEPVYAVEPAPTPVPARHPPWTSERVEAERKHEIYRAWRLTLAWRRGRRLGDRDD